MKKSIISLLYFAVAATGMTSCDGLEISQNGKLEGYWHIVEFDTLATGGVCALAVSIVAKATIPTIHFLIIKQIIQ